MSPLLHSPDAPGAALTITGNGTFRHLDSLRELPAWAVISSTALSYFIVGRLALLLAIPPGYAAPIWPAAAIALVAVLVYRTPAAWGIWLGSTLVNATQAWPADPDFSWVGILHIGATPAVIGLGAAAQGLVGAWLIRRSVGFPCVLDRPRSIGAFLLLGGPISCVISPTVGVGVLAHQGIVSPENAPFNWATWWVGDALGVLLFSLLILPFLLASHPLWKQRRGFLPAALSVIGALMVALYMHVSAKEVTRQQDSFELHVREIHARLQAELSRDIEVLYGLSSLFQSQAQVSREEFGLYVNTHFLQRHSGMQAFGWNPIVSQRSRVAYEQQARHDGIADFSIRERSVTGALGAAASRAEYAPVYYIEPLIGNEAALGFDLLSNPIRAAAIGKARETLEAAATKPIQLVQSASASPATIIFLPVMQGSPHVQVTGLVSGVLRVSDWMDNTLGPIPLDDVIIRISDSPDGAKTLYHAAVQPPVSQFQVKLPIRVADQTWWMHTQASQTFLAQTRSYTPWNLLAVGLLFASLLGAYLLTISGESYRAEQHSEKLQQMLIELQETQSELLDSKKLASLGGMVAGLAHELNTPLGNITTATSVVIDGIKQVQSQLESGKLTHERLQTSLTRWAESAQIGANSVHRAAELVRTFKTVILDRSVHDVASIDLNEFIQGLLNDLNVVHGSNQVGIEFKPSPEPLQIETVPIGISQVITNLVNNSTLHAFDANGGQIRISTSRSAKGVLLVVEDNGCGISPQHLDKIFEPFFTTKRGRGGTGLGLHLVHNLVKNQLQGRIRVSSESGHGTRFEIELPRELP